MVISFVPLWCSYFAPKPMSWSRGMAKSELNDSIRNGENACCRRYNLPPPFFTNGFVDDAADRPAVLGEIDEALGGKATHRVKGVLIDAAEVGREDDVVELAQAAHGGERFGF